MKKNNAQITGPEELNKYLQTTSFVTWLVLILVSAVLIVFFAWACIYKLNVRLIGDVSIEGGVAALEIKEADLSKLKEGQTVYIADKEGKILSLDAEGGIVVSSFDLENGKYTYTIVLEEKRPIDFLIGK